MKITPFRAMINVENKNFIQKSKEHNKVKTEGEDADKFFLDVL